MLQTVSGLVLTYLWLGRMFRPRFILVWNIFLFYVISLVQFSALFSWDIVQRHSFIDTNRPATQYTTILKNTVSTTKKKNSE
jgi:DNA-binding helix-hairpin-helix protein with protein kinase domain